MILQLAITNKHNFETSWHVGQETKMIFVPTSLKNVFIGTQWLYHHHCLLIDRLHGGAHIWLSPKTIVQIFFFFKSETRRGNQQIDSAGPFSSPFTGITWDWTKARFGLRVWAVQLQAGMFSLLIESFKSSHWAYW